VLHPKYGRRPHSDVGAQQQADSQQQRLWRLVDFFDDVFRFLYWIHNVSLLMPRVSARRVDG